MVGVAPHGQLRRAFLYYVERERAQPYRPFLHYNSWYDLGYGRGKILEPDALKVIDLFGKELIEQRKVVMDSFVPDDGWDDPATLWRFHEGFPHGFTALQQAAERYHAEVGAWLSPWGGYGKAKEERMKYGLKEGFETNKNGFSLAGPKYYARFRDACLGMVRDYRCELLQVRRHQLRRCPDRRAGGVRGGRRGPAAADRRPARRPNPTCSSTSRPARGPRPTGSGTRTRPGGPAATGAPAAGARSGSSRSPTATPRPIRTSYAGRRSTRSTR